MNRKNLPYRTGVGIMLINKNKEIFVAKRIDTISEAWQMPQGGVDENESTSNAALRELKEETSITSAKIICESRDWYDYDLPIELIPKVWGGKYRGQRQKWYLLEFFGLEKEINLNTEHPEFKEYKWLEPPYVPKFIVSFKRKLYQDLIEEFSDYLKTS